MLAQATVCKTAQTGVRFPSCSPFGIMVSMKPTWHDFLKVAANQPVFGSKEWLVANFDDIDSASECKKSSPEWRAAEALFRKMSKKKVGGYVYNVLKTKGTWDEQPVKNVIAHIVLGKNGPGNQADYLAELSKAIGRKNSILDDHLDAVDDLWDFLITLKHTESEKKANWMTDTFVVSPLSALYRRQNEVYKAEQAARSEQARAKSQATTVAQSAPTKKTAPDRTDALTQIAQGVSNSYQQGSLARPKFMSQGKVIAR